MSVDKKCLDISKSVVEGTDARRRLSSTRTGIVGSYLVWYKIVDRGFLRGRQHVRRPNNCLRDLTKISLKGIHGQNA
jgi:hypothetical protein